MDTSLDLYTVRYNILCLLEENTQRRIIYAANNLRGELRPFTTFFRSRGENSRGRNAFRSRRDERTPRGLPRRIPRPGLLPIWISARLVLSATVAKSHLCTCDEHASMSVRGLLSSRVDRCAGEISLKIMRKCAHSDDMTRILGNTTPSFRSISFHNI